MYLQSIGQGTGLFGSIKSSDLTKASATSAVKSKQPVAAGVQGDGFLDRPVSNVRKIIAQRLLESKQVNDSF